VETRVCGFNASFSFHTNMSLSGLCTSFSKVTLFSLREVFREPQKCVGGQSSAPDPARGEVDVDDKEISSTGLSPRLRWSTLSLRVVSRTGQCITSVVHCIALLHIFFSSFFALHVIIVLDVLLGALTSVLHTSVRRVCTVSSRLQCVWRCQQRCRPTVRTSTSTSSAAAVWL